MKAVYKYLIKPTDVQEIKMPINAKILCVQTQNNHPFIWAEVDTEETETELRTIYMHGTGHPYSKEYKNYIGTFQMLEGYVEQGSLVFHVFE